MAGINPRELTKSELAELLTKSGGKVISSEHLKRDAAAGAPFNGDGSIGLIEYAAWLAAKHTE